MSVEMRSEISCGESGVKDSENWFGEWARYIPTEESIKNSADHGIDKFTAYSTPHNESASYRSHGIIISVHSRHNVKHALLRRTLYNRNSHKPNAYPTNSYTIPSPSHAITKKTRNTSSIPSLSQPRTTIREFPSTTRIGQTNSGLE
jgi:hypothetical protein